MTWSYFDPAKGQYQTVTTEPVSVTVATPPPPPTQPQTGPAGTTEAGSASSTQPQLNRPPTTPPAAPTGIPRDALPGSESVPTPWSTRVFAIALLSPVPILLILWLALAWRQARITDPFRSQREAQKRLRHTLAEMRVMSDAARLHRLLLDWQHDAAVLWQLRTAVPAVHHFRTVALPGTEAASAAWPTLWSDAERALYRAEGKLPVDWVDRAEAALAEKPVPKFSGVQLFRGRNLLPFAAALLMTFFLFPKLHAQDAKALYDKGNFSEAETGWRKTLADNGTDWIARHNLALALAQQSRWGEASAQAVAAFVQHPRDLSVQWHLSLLADRAGFTPGSLTGFLTPTPLHTVAEQLSPAEWQRVLVGAVAVAMLGFAAFLLRAYFGWGRWSVVIGLLLLCLSVLTGIAGSLSLGTYREAGDARAAIVWKPSLLRSIPTEADTTQKTAPLAAGSVAIIDKTFLGWARLAFSNGQTGWVRQDDLVRLWQ